MSSFQTLFTLSPADLPYKSATAMRLALTPSLASEEVNNMYVNLMHRSKAITGR
jgi:hypothetical protein